MKQVTRVLCTMNSMNVFVEFAAFRADTIPTAINSYKFHRLNSMKTKIETFGKLVNNSSRGSYIWFNIS